MKRLKFSDPLPELILSGKKDITWRINDDKNISFDDILSLCRSDGTEFAKARVKWVKLTKFLYLTKEDKQGHEPFLSEEDMYKTYSKYYNIPITPQTPLKIVKLIISSQH